MATSIFNFPTTGVYSGLQLVNQLNSAFASLITNNAGATPPADPVLDQFWYNTTNDTLYVYNGATWVQTAFGAPFVGVQIISGGMTVAPAQFGTLIEAQGQSAYSIALPDASDYVGVNTAVFSNINTSSPVTVSVTAGSIVGTGSSGSYATLPYGSWALFESDGYNWLMMSTAGYALLGGSGTQAFDVGTATGPSNAVPLSQAQSSFAGVNGNSSETFAVANATASQDAVNLGQANGLYPTLAGNNTLAGNQTIQGTVAVPANAGEITGGAMPSGMTAAWVQAAFSSAYAGLIQNFYFNGTQVYSLSADGAITAQSATLSSASVGTASITGAITVPDGVAAQNPITVNQISGGTLSPTFDNVTAGSGAFNNLNSPAISGVFNGSSVTASGTVSGATVLGGLISGGALAASGGTFWDVVVSGGISVNSSITVSGATAGSIITTMPERGVYKKYAAYALAYENDTTTNQTIIFPVPFVYTPTVTTNESGLTLSVSLTELTINAPNNTTAYTGFILVEGF